MTPSTLYEDVSRRSTYANTNTAVLKTSEVDGNSAEPDGLSGGG